MNELFAAMCTYIKTHFPTGLQYGRRVQDTTTSKSQNGQDADDDADENASGDNYVSDFTVLISTHLTKDTQVCEKLGGPVAEQACVAAEAWKEEEVFLKKAVSTPKPADVQQMLNPIAEPSTQPACTEAVPEIVMMTELRNPPKRRQFIPHS